MFRRIDLVSAEKLGVGLGDPCRRIAKALSLGIVAGPDQERPYRGFGFIPRHRVAIERRLQRKLAVIFYWLI
jgi:hypothetical protein